MKNVIFISPNFPTNYWQFCRELRNNGLTVLGIGDQPYDELLPELKENLNEYYKVDSLEDYDKVYRAVAFFTFKYGRIDFIESNNEYWLEQDARLRTDFNIHTGFQMRDLPRIKYKSKMKKYYEKAGIPVARYHLVDTVKKCQDFIKEVRYPVIVKPDNGVGASHTYKLENDADLEAFFAEKEPDVSYIMEEFINAEINSYDAIIDSSGTPIFETGNCTPISIMDSVNYGDDAIFYIEKNLADDTKKAGRDTVKSFGVRSRFVHFEFFRLLADHEGIGKKGTIMALEVNMRPCGGFTPEMINFARETDVYKIWADMVAFDHTEKEIGGYHYCGFAGLRDYKDYVLSHEEILEKYGDHLKMTTRLPDALSAAMGNKIYMATFDTKEELDTFFRDLLEVKEAKA
ncbi:MAG: ATP-grasp domain-containing protein [Clostridiales bacterium]|nr:ATP-grasp domain-containing protein [Clostridiales bacterium]